MLQGFDSSDDFLAGSSQLTLNYHEGTLMIGETIVVRGRVRRRIAIGAAPDRRAIVAELVGSDVQELMISDVESMIAAPRRARLPDAQATIRNSKKSINS